MLKIANLHVYMIYIIIEKCSDGEMFGLGHFLFGRKNVRTFLFVRKFIGLKIFVIYVAVILFL